MPILPLSEIRRANDLQARDQSHWTRDGAERTALDPAHVAALVEVLRSGRTFSTRPIVYQDEAGYWLADGWHRLAAYEVVDQTEIEVEIREGGRRAAFRHALGANAEHGKPRTQKDKRRAVDLALGDAEIGALSNREIADITGTSHTFVAGRRELRAAGEAMRQAPPRSRAHGLAKARGALVAALRAAEDAGVEMFDLQGAPGQVVALWYEGIEELSRGQIEEAIRALGEAHGAATRPKPTPDLLPGQQLITGGEVPAVTLASQRRAESRALGARIGRCIAALRLMDPHDLVHLGGDVGLVEAGILLGSATSAPWAEIELTTLEAALFPATTPDRDDSPGSLVALESMCPDPAPPVASAGSPSAAGEREVPHVIAADSAAPATNGAGQTYSAPAGTTSPASTATTERPESWQAAITWALGLPVDAPLGQVVATVQVLRIRADQVPVLEADLQRAHERAEGLAAELQQVQADYRWALQGGTEAVGEVAKAAQAQIDALKAEAERLRAMGQEESRRLTVAEREVKRLTAHLEIADEEIDAVRRMEQASYQQLEARHLEEIARLQAQVCALAEDRDRAVKLALDCAPDEVPAGWPEGWIADSDVGGHTHAAWHGPRRPDGSRGPSAVIYTVTGGGYETAMELTFEDRAEDAAEQLRRMAWGLAGRPLPASVASLPDEAPAPAASVIKGLMPWNAPRWLASVRERLGAEPDEDVAWDAGPGVHAADVRRERERLGIPEYVAPPDPLAIYRPWKGTADELAAHLTALEPGALVSLGQAIGEAGGGRLVERLTVRIMRASSALEGC